MDARVAVDLELPPLATSAGEARRVLREALSGAESDDSVDAAQLAISEIVTNALVHAGTTMRLRVLVEGDRLRVELSDGSPHLPHRRDYSTVAATGRGLHMVSQVVDRWGAFADGNGKVVWFEVTEKGAGTGAGDELWPSAVPERAGPAQAADEAGPAAEVHLVNLPLLMHAAWQEHASALLREIMLMRLNDDLAALERHAAVSDALNLLFEQVPRPDLGDDSEAIMAGATEPAVSAERLVLRVPAASLSHFELLEEMLEEAVDLADAGELLSFPTQPELRVMRRWMCGQIREQVAGGAPTAWVSASDALPPRAPGELGWDPAGVDRSERLLVAADDANRIVAASDPALAFLGHPDRGAVVGQRLISLIPLRYHQAHIAGFTLHLVNGRSPLIGHAVTVPMVRADGSEVEVSLRIEATQLASGRKVFVADIEPTTA